jgi:hypothetical protein
MPGRAFMYTEEEGAGVGQHESIGGADDAACLLQFECSLSRGATISLMSLQEEPYHGL